MLPPWLAGSPCSARSRILDAPRGCQGAVQGTAAAGREGIVSPTAASCSHGKLRAAAAAAVEKMVLQILQLWQAAAGLQTSRVMSTQKEEPYLLQISSRAACLSCSDLRCRAVTRGVSVSRRQRADFKKWSFGKNITWALWKLYVSSARK